MFLDMHSKQRMSIQYDFYAILNTDIFLICAVYKLPGQQDNSNNCQSPRRMLSPSIGLFEQISVGFI